MRTPRFPITDELLAAYISAFEEPHGEGETTIHIDDDGEATGSITEELSRAEPRRTSRVVLLDPDDRILLMRLAVGPQAASGSGDGDQALWVTLGGRIEPGESVLTAAERELREETGIGDAIVGPVVWYGEQVLKINGTPRLLKETFVLARCSSSTFNDRGWSVEERSAIAEMQWWSLGELAAASQAIKPPGLGVLLRELLDALYTNRDGPVSVPKIDLQ
jgi:8-oxo-dGTP pyrophosphatase MutT (NUDIX family)